MTWKRSWMLLNYRPSKKNDFIVEEGKTSRYIGFVESGMFQYYVIKDGEERTSYVSIENTFFASVLSFISETPALENIKALVDGSISMISKPRLKNWCRKSLLSKIFISAY